MRALGTSSDRHLRVMLVGKSERKRGTGDAVTYYVEVLVAVVLAIRQRVWDC